MKIVWEKICNFVNHFAKIFGNYFAKRIGKKLQIKILNLNPVCVSDLFLPRQHEKQI
jgi:hypothetical protein